MMINVPKAIVSGLLLTIVLLLGILIPRAVALQNPAAVYCQALGYDYIVEPTEAGERGLCQLPNDQTVDAWDFLRGKVALEWSYCAREGYEARHVEDSEICRDCTVCILPDGTETEVTELMGLTFEGTACGDGNCGFPENFERCPQDCPSGGFDGYCDRVEDGIVDPDCPEGDDPDYVAEGEEGGGFPIIPIVVAVVAVVAVAAVVTLFIKRRGRPPAKEG